MAPVSDDETEDEETDAEEWTNWSGSVSFEPDRILEPDSESELQEIVRRCAEEDQTVRVAGAGHSWTPVVETEDIVVSLTNMTGVVDHDPEAKTATLYAGTTLEEAGTELHDRNLALPNLGDVTMQTVAGAFGTGTHGTGPEFENWRADVGWRLLVRTVAADDAMLSTEYDRDVMTISCIQNAELEHWPYFEDVEPIFNEYDGRPHWGKKHTLRAPELRERYPEWDRFQELRRELDPEGVFMTDYLEDLLGATTDDERSDETRTGDGQPRATVSAQRWRRDGVPRGDPPLRGWPRGGPVPAHRRASASAPRSDQRPDRPVRAAAGRGLRDRRRVERPGRRPVESAGYASGRERGPLDARVRRVIEAGPSTSDDIGFPTIPPRPRRSPLVE
jgi:hypothetical protein